MSDNKKAIIAILLGTLIGSASATVVKMGVKDMPPFTFTFLRFFIASLCIIPFFLHRRFDKKTLTQLILLSLLATGNIVLFSFGVALTTATIGQLLYAGVPIITAFVIFLLFKESLPTMKSIGIIIGFLGVGIIVLLPVLEKGQLFAGNLLGNMLIGLGVILYSFYMVYSKKLLKMQSPFVITSMFIFTTTIAVLPFFLGELSVRWWEHMTVTTVLTITYASIGATILTYILNQYAIKHGGAVLASVGFYLLPVFSTMVAFLFLDERLIAGIIIGGSIALFGSYLVMK